MQEANPFNLLSSPLEGTKLIEASAGTGKTYAITCLYLRLVIERKFSAKNILAVTFTEAATQELKDRIRKKLKEAVEAFGKGKSEDEFLNGLVTNLKDIPGVRDHLVQVLRDFAFFYRLQLPFIFTF